MEMSRTKRRALKSGDLVRYLGSKPIHQVVRILDNGLVRVLTDRGVFRTITRPENLRVVEV